MHFFADRPDWTTDVQWYFVDAKTPVLEIATVFRSRLYERELPQLPLGEEIDFHPYSPGAAPVDVDGAVFCGTPLQWLNGSVSTDPVSPVDPDTGVPACCGPAGFFVAGGVVVGGALTVGHGPLLTFNDAVVAGGAITQTLIQPITPGGVVAGGGDNLTGGIIISTGGAAVGGSVGFLAGELLDVAGGAAVGGSGGFLAGELLDVAGGAAVGGSGGFLAGELLDVGGGATVGGADGFVAGGLFNLAGGAAVGGSGGFVVSELLDVAGGAAVGGGGGFVSAGMIDVAGGAVVGGAWILILGREGFFVGGSIAGGVEALRAGDVSTSVGGIATGGGDGFESGLIPATSGGAVADGEATMPAVVIVECCAEALPADCVLQIQNKTGSCSCLPDAIPMSWDGAKWAGSSVANTCGIDTADWSVRCETEFFDRFVLKDTDGDQDMTLVSCDPLDVRLFVGGRSYCTDTFEVLFEAL